MLNNEQAEELSLGSRVVALDTSTHPRERKEFSQGHITLL